MARKRVLKFHNYERIRKPYTEVISVLFRLIGVLRPRLSLIGKIIIFVILSSIAILSIPRLIGVFFDKVIVVTNLPPDIRVRFILVLAGTITGISFLYLILQGLKNIATEKLGLEISFKIRKELFDKLLILSPQFYTRHNIGGLLSRIMDDAQIIENMTKEAVVSLFIAPLAFCIILVVLLYLDWKLAMLSLLPIPMVLVVMIFFLTPMRRLRQTIKEKCEYIFSYLNERLSAIDLLGLYDKNLSESERFFRISSDYQEIRFKHAKLYSRYLPMLGFVTSTGIVTVLTYGGLYSINEGLTAGGLVSFITYLEYLYSQLGSISFANYVIQSITVHGEKILEVIDAKPDIIDGDKDILGWDLDIEFSNVVFSYDGITNVLDGANFHIVFGQRTGIVGATGSGKSTIARLILRFYDPQRGYIRLGRYNLRELKLSSLRANLSMVMQDEFLFSDTIFNNLAYGKPDVKEPEITEVAKITMADKFILGLKEGYNTIIGERGSTLSAGERQRICLLRVLLRRPKILILDEATSGLDMDTERYVLDGIFDFLKGSTIIVISHRESAIRKCESLYEIRKGYVHPVRLQDANHK